MLSSLVLAVSADAPQQEIQRHEALEPRTRQRLLAVDLHRRVLAQLAATYRATLLDAPPGPDGAGEDLFLDLHLRSEPGREQLAQSLLDGLRTKLGEEIPGCSARQP